MDILEKFDQLAIKLDQEGKRKVHYNSISNFIYYLVYHPKINERKNVKLQELGEVRMKKQLLEYLEIVSSQEITMNVSSQLYEEYLFKIGDFMMEYYHFSGNGGKLNIIGVILTLILGIIVDTLVFAVTQKIYFISFLFIVLFFVRLYVKYKSKRLYGFMW